MLSSKFLLLLPPFINLIQERRYMLWNSPLVTIEAALLLTMPYVLQSVACALERNPSLLLLGSVFYSCIRLIGLQFCSFCLSSCQMMMIMMMIIIC